MHYAYTNRFIKVLACFFDFAGGVFFWKKRINTENISSIIVVKLDHLGDCFLMTPLFEHLKNEFPEVMIDVVCLESSTTIFKNSPFIRNIISFNKKKAIRGVYRAATMLDFFKLIFLLRKNKYNICIDPRGDFYAACIGFLSGIKHRIGFEKEEVGGFLYTIRLQYDRHEHEIEKYRYILNVFSVDNLKDWKPRVFPTNNEKNIVEKIIFTASKPYAVIHLGAGVAYKILPVERWIPLIEFLRAQNYEVFLVGSDDDRLYANKILSLKVGEFIHNCVGKFSLRETYFFISRSSLFLGNDSVLGHFAGALGIPAVIAMNGLVNEGRWCPLVDCVRVISGMDVNHVCAYDACVYPCSHMESISSDAILIALQNLIQ